MIRLALILILFMLAAATSALAEEKLLAHDKGAADTFEKLATDGHYIQFSSPAWEHTFTQELSLYGYRFGDVGKTMGTVVIWSLKRNPEASAPLRPGQDAPPQFIADIHTRKQFPLSSLPAQAGWFKLPLDAVELPKEFGVSLFTYSGEDKGAWIGLAKGSSSVSGAGHPSVMASQPKIDFRRDGRNWMVRLMVRDSIAPATGITSADISGQNFAFHDDGTADGFATVQKNGPTVTFNSAGNRMFKRVYVYGQLAGDWFQTNREAGVWVLDDDYGILYHAKLPYRRFTNVPGWAYVDIPEIGVPQRYHIVVEPVSRPQVQMLIGYDGSQDNKASTFGDAGARQIWAIEAPEERTNWMIRVEYR